MAARPLFFALRVSAVLFAAAALTWYVIYRAKSAPSEKLRTRFSSTKAQNIASVYAAARAAGATFVAADREISPMLLSNDSDDAMPGTKSGMALRPGDISRIFSNNSEDIRTLGHLESPPRVILDDKPFRLTFDDKSPDTDDGKPAALQTTDSPTSSRRESEPHPPSPP